MGDRPAARLQPTPAPPESPAFLGLCPCLWAWDATDPTCRRVVKDSVARTALRAQGLWGRTLCCHPAPLPGAPLMGMPQDPPAHAAPHLASKAAGEAPGRVRSRWQVAGAQGPRILGTWRICLQGNTACRPAALWLAWPLAWLFLGHLSSLCLGLWSTHRPLHCAFWCGSCCGPHMGRECGPLRAQLLQGQRGRLLCTGCGRPAAWTSPRPQLSALTAGLTGHLQTVSAAPLTRAAHLHPSPHSRDQDPWVHLFPDPCHPVMSSILPRPW